MDLDKIKNFEQLYQRTVKACESNNAKEIKDMLSSDCYPSLTQKEKETNIFVIANDLFENTKEGQDILKYLIFDYGINEDHLFHEHDAKEVKAMFEARSLNNELDNSNKPSKKPKI
jgi:hypothetical protein